MMPILLTDLGSAAKRITMQTAVQAERNKSRVCSRYPALRCSCCFSSIGPKVITLPGTYDLRDIVSNSSMGQAVSKIHFDAQRIGEAHLFELVPRSKSP